MNKKTLAGKGNKMEDIKTEDRLRKYTFNVDGEIVDITASDRAIVKSLRAYDDLLILAYQTLDVIRLLKEGKPMPLGYFEQVVQNTIKKAEGK